MSGKKEYLFKPVSSKYLENFIESQDEEFLDILDNDRKLNLICVVCEDENIADSVTVSTYLNVKVIVHLAGYLNSQKSEIANTLENTLNVEISESFVSDYMRLIGDEFGYDHFYKSDLFSFLIYQGNKHLDTLVISITDEFGIDFYTKNFDNVKFIFVQDNFIIPDENDKCHVMQMYDEFNPNHALVSYYNCNSQDEVEEQVNSAIDKLVENDKLVIR